MKKRYKRPKTWHHPRLWLSRIIRAWPFVFWLLIIFVVYLLYGESDRLVGLTGAVETVVEPVAGLTTARLKSINVVLGQRVKAGDVIAEMDTALVEAELAMDEAAVLEAEFTQARFQSDTLLLTGRFQGDLEDAEATLAEERLRVEREKAELTGLLSEQARMQRLLEQRVIREPDIRDTQSQIAALEKSVEESPKLLTVYENRVSHAKQRLDGVRRWLRLEEGEDASAAIARNVEVRSALTELMRKMGRVQLSTYSLKATRDGVVSRIFHEEGSVIQAGDPIVRLVEPTPVHIIGFLPEQYVGDLQVGRTGIATPQRTMGAKIPVVVKAISPEVTALPGRVSPIQGQAVRGRRVVFAIQGKDHGLVPGQTVVIHDPEAHNIVAQLGRRLKRLISTSSRGE